MARRLAVFLSLVLACGSVGVVQAQGVSWVPWHGSVPRNAVRGGVDQNGSVTLYVCRGQHINGVHPGKLLDGRCRIGWGGKEVVLSRFEVLVSGSQPHRPEGGRR